MYFEEGIDVSNINILRKISNECEVKLSDNFFNEEGDKEIQQFAYQLANQYDISGVPFFIINNKYVLSGAQDSKTFIKIFRKILQN